LLAGEGSGNNYAYLVTDDKTKQAVIIDPANPSESVYSLPSVPYTRTDKYIECYHISRKPPTMASS
jgi:hypothetical protein